MEGYQRAWEIGSTEQIREVGRWRKRRSPSKTQDRSLGLRAAKISIDSYRKHLATVARNWEQSEGESKPKAKPASVWIA